MTNVTVHAVICYIKQRKILKYSNSRTVIYNTRSVYDMPFDQTNCCQMRTEILKIWAEHQFLSA